MRWGIVEKTVPDPENSHFAQSEPTLWANDSVLHRDWRDSTGIDGTPPGLTGGTHAGCAPVCWTDSVSEQIPWMSGVIEQMDPVSAEVFSPGLAADSTCHSLTPGPNGVRYSRNGAIFLS